MLPTLLLALSLAAGQRAAADEHETELDERERARALFEASRASVKELARRRLEAVDKVLDAFRSQFRAGRINAQSVAAAQTMRTRAALPPARNDWTDDLLLDEWKMRWEVYRYAKAMFDAGIPSALIFHAQAELLEAEIQMALRREKPAKK